MCSGKVTKETNHLQSVTKGHVPIFLGIQMKNLSKLLRDIFSSYDLY